MIRAFLLATAVFALSACAVKPQAEFKRAFHIDSSKGVFVIRGSLDGTLDVRADVIVVSVHSGRIESVLNDQADLGLQAMLATPGPRDAKRLTQSNVQSIGSFKKGEPRVLAEPLTFSMPRPANSDFENQWLVFEFFQTDHNFSVACETRNLIDAHPETLKRPSSVCWASN